MLMDRTTEAIAHFIGLFAMTVEQSWRQDEFQKFVAKFPPNGDLGDLLNVQTAFSAPHTLIDYDPGIAYLPQGWSVVPVIPWSDIDFAPPEISIHGAAKTAYPGFLPPSFQQALGTGQQIILPDIPFPGSVATYINQAIQLSDDDYFGVGGHGLRFSPQAAGDAQIVELFDAASGLSPFSIDEIAGNSAALKQLVVEVNDSIASFDPQPAEGQTVFVHKAPGIEGSFVNGQQVDEAPRLSDHFDFDARLDAIPGPDDPLPANATLTNGEWKIDVAVDADTGSNILINNTYLQSLWTGARVTAVVGDHYETNAIVQINAWCDADAVSQAVSDWDKDPVETQAFNVATFSRSDPAADAPVPAEDLGFPQHWIIKEVQGDLLIVNWVKQFTFMSDDDVGILSSSGVTTMVCSGSNIAYNDVSILDLGFAYDLIMIGGSWYDLNLIQQTNILCDNDLIGAVAGFETEGEGSVSTSGNLLWNKAYIHNVGASNQSEALSDSYLDTANGLAAGDDHIGGGVLSDAAFQGLGALRVLYISGDLVNVQYASQTNILGDSDQIALAMDAIGPHPEAEWTLTTGSNAVINETVIADLDTLGKVYVGGEQYSSDLLVQADIISTDPDFQSQNPDQLVNEAVAFLADDPLESTGDDYGNPGNLDPESAHGDALQTLIG